LSDERRIADARTFVVNSLAARAQSVAEVQAKLSRRGLSEDEVAGVIAQAASLGYLDDGVLAAQLARGQRARGYGRRRAERELRRRGLGDVESAAALDEAYGGTDEVALARAALGSRATADPRAERRAVAFLVRRGFSSRAAWSVVRERRSGPP
jgi:SOS response regulatory protein OraA/RecX